MPSVASFGARPIISADGLGLRSNTRLNADVLRRLFSDLDTDKDGHVNRIETCMALHRLQISVSTAKIISFFRHIHSPAEGQAVRSRNTHHLPMKEVINYNEFVAFVTAAYDQQQQKRSQHRGSPVRNARNDDQDNALPLPAPSTSMPIYSRQTVSPRAKTSTRAHTPLPEREQDVRVYEMPDADHEPNVLEERVIREIPDLLVSRMLSETTNEAANEAAASVVRKSLESLVGNGSVDDRTVKEITQELIRERLRNIGPFNQHDEEDVTGLRRAAAYYNEQMVQGDFESSSVADGSRSEDLINWVDVLTEEQVSGLVQRIWKDKQASLHSASIGAVEDSNIQDPHTDIPEDQTVSRIDQATDTSELEVSRVATLSEKAVQASGDNDQGEPTTILEPASDIVPEKKQGEDAVSSTATMSRSNPTQTQLARAIGTSFDPSGNSHELFRAVTSIQILQQLRQQRRTHRVMLDSPSGDEAVTRFREPNVANRNCDISAVRMDPPMKTPLLSSEVDLESVASRSDITDQSHQHSQEEHGFLPLPNTEPVPLTEKFLDVGGSVSNVSSHEFLVRGSISTSSSALSSTSDNHHLHGMYQEIDHLQHYTRSAPRRQRPRRCRRALSASGSSVPDSLCSAELSEGEISRDEATELSDGEIYGESKRNYVKRKNAIRGTMKSPDDEISLHNSVESGELPSMIEETHAGFRRQLVAQSVTSSVESGEIEDGTVPG